MIKKNVTSTGKLDFLKNRITLNREYRNRKTNLKGYPIEIAIELTNFCNLDCVFCPHEKMKRRQGFIGLSLFKKIIDEVAGYVESIELDILGESTMHPDICKMINYCRQAGLKTLLNSNMTKVDMKLAQSLVDAGLDTIVMSMDGTDKDTYESIRRRANFDKTKENIQSMLSLKPKNLFRVVQFVYFSLNKHQVRQFMKEWSRNGADCVRLRPYQNIDKERLSLNAIAGSLRNFKKPCVQVWKKMAICWDGSVVLCCLDYDKFRVVGDANKQGIFEIWNSGSMQEARQILTSGKWDNLLLCKDCFPFEPNEAMLWGSIFFDPIQVRKIMFIFEKLKVLYGLHFFRYL